MKNIFSKFLVATACAGTLSLTGCIEETVPTSVATQDQLSSSAQATSALVWAMPAIFNKYATYSSDYAYDWGYGSIMHMRDVMTADMAIVSSGYNWYTSWSTNSNLGERYVSTYFAWTYFWKAIQTTNNLIGAVNEESATDEQKGYLGAGYAFRALFYLDAARTYEYLPCDKTSGVSEMGNNIVNLTLPIVTDKTTEEDSRNNPRVSREVMAKFIEDDLNKAEELIPNLEAEVKPANYNKTLPHLSTVYGLKARLYMWIEDYEKAAEYAEKAIALGHNKLMTEKEWTDVKTGFNTPVSSWMWCSTSNKEDDVVKSGILNWTSWLSNETSFGYAAAGPYVMIGSELYNRISNDDWRKLCFKAPETNPLSGSEEVLDEELFEALPTYASLKFRPGQGETDDHLTAAVVSYPIMRIEEMYLIKAEAIAHSDAAQGKALLEAFVKTRNAGYSCKATSQDDVIDEIFNQKRIEFFGEGITFFDYKRLNKSVDRTLSTNWDPSENFKTSGRPAWMNLCIAYQEKSNNKGVEGFENPDPSDVYVPVEAE